MRELSEISMSRTSTEKSLEAARNPILPASKAQLAHAEEAWCQSEVLGIDTEFVRERTYRAELGLFQVSDGKTAWLLDPQIPGTLEPVTRLMNHPGIVKVLHSGSEDLEIILHETGVIPAPMVDTQIACAMLGQPLQLSYHNAIKWLFDLETDKDQTRSNWCKRPLTERQLRYAALDVVLLPKMLDELKPMLQNKDRWDWLLEDVERMRRQASVPIEAQRAYLRVSGAGNLDGANLKVLRGLAHWREDIAKKRNRARGFVINDAGLMQLARRKPASIAEIRELGEIHPGALARYEETLLAIIADAPSDPLPVEKIEPLDDKQRRELNALRTDVRRASERLGVDPALLASRRELEKLVRAASNGDPVPERYLGWRKALLGDRLTALIDKQR